MVEPVQGQRLIADMGKPRHHADHAGQRQAAFGPGDLFLGENLDFRVYQHCHGNGFRFFFVRRLFIRLVFVAITGPALGNVKDHHPFRHVDLGRRQSDPGGIGQGIHHIGDQTVDFRRLGVGNRVCRPFEHRMAHFGDFQYGHGSGFPSIITNCMRFYSWFRAFGPFPNGTDMIEPAPHLGNAYVSSR